MHANMHVIYLRLLDPFVYPSTWISLTCSPMHQAACCYDLGVSQKCPKSVVKRETCENKNEKMEEKGGGETQPHTALYMY